MVEEATPEVWEALEEVVKDRPVLLTVLQHCTVWVFKPFIQR